MDELELKNRTKQFALTKNADELVAIMVASRKSAKSGYPNRKSQIKNRKSE